MWIEIRAGNKGKSQIISLWNLLLLFFLINKWQLFVATLQNLFALFAPPFIFWPIICCSWGSHPVTDLPVPIFCLSSQFSYIELSVISNSSTQICSVFHIQVQRSYWLNFSSTSDLEYLVLNKKKKKVNQKCLKSLINENLDVWGCR